MKILYLDLGMGAAGDMLSAALLELFPESERQGIMDKLNSLGIPKVHFEAEPSVKCGITGTHMSVKVDGTEEGEESGGHTHAHNSMTGIEHIINDHMHIDEELRRDITAVYGLIAEAESHVHGVPVSEIHFHEVGNMDAIADVTAVSLMISMLKPDRIISSPVNTGSGQVRCAHGIMPVPAPATAYLLQGIPSYDNGIKGELLTPTGAALVRHFADGFGNRPAMNIERIGYGMGRKDFEAANCVRAVLGSDAWLQKTTEHAETAYDGCRHADVKENVNEGGGISRDEDCACSELTGTAVELSANIDDMSAEELGYASMQLLKAGALDVWTESVYMKKQRPGVVLKLLCTEDMRYTLVRDIFKFTSTIGVREALMRRYTLKRELLEQDTELGRVRFKHVSGYGVDRVKAEYDDLAAIADRKHISVSEVRRIINP